MWRTSLTVWLPAYIQSCIYLNRIHISFKSFWFGFIQLDKEWLLRKHARSVYYPKQYQNQSMIKYWQQNFWVCASQSEKFADYRLKSLNKSKVTQQNYKIIFISAIWQITQRANAVRLGCHHQYASVHYYSLQSVALTTKHIPTSAMLSACKCYLKVTNTLPKTK